VFGDAKLKLMPSHKGISNKYQFQISKLLSRRLEISTNWTRFLNKNKSGIGHLKFDIGYWKFKEGFSLLLGLIVSTAILILSASQFERITNFVRFGSNKVIEQQAINLAEAGVDYAIWKLNKTAGSFYGDGTEIPIANLGTFFVTVTDNGPSFKTIRSTGYVPDFANKRGQAAVEVQVYVGGETIAFNYAVQVGTGGVFLANSATINGNVYSNGSITGSGSSTIDGDAYAVGTISSPDPLVTGTKNPGAPAQPLPTIDYQFWKDTALAGGTESTNCTISADTSIGPKKYACSLFITNNAVVTLNGPLWITGNFSMSQGGTTLKLNDTFGSNGTAMIVDGTISLTQGGVLEPTSATPKGYILLATTSTLDPAISISQGGATALFYALDSGAELSQTADVVSLISNKLTLKNSAVLNYDTGLASALFTTGPGGAWQIKKGTYRYTK